MIRKILILIVLLTLGLCLYARESSPFHADFVQNAQGMLKEGRSGLFTLNLVNTTGNAMTNVTISAQSPELELHFFEQKGSVNLDAGQMESFEFDLFDPMGITAKGDLVIIVTFTDLYGNTQTMELAAGEVTCE